MAKKKPKENLSMQRLKQLYKKKLQKVKIYLWTACTGLPKRTGAYLSSGSKSASMAAWAMGRVNSFIRGGHSQDNDIKKKVRVVPKKKKK